MIKINNRVSNIVIKRNNVTNQSQNFKNLLFLTHFLFRSSNFGLELLNWFLKNAFTKRHEKFKIKNNNF